METPETRKFVRYERLVDSLPDAWTLVMVHVDEFVTPNIEITGELGNWDGMEEPTRVKYRASVFGDVEGGW